MRAYSELYLNDAMELLSECFDCLINRRGIDCDSAADIFIVSGYAKHFEKGDPYVLSGMSGEELAQKIIDKTYQIKPQKLMFLSDGETRESWAGYCLAYYQWQSALSFKEIFAAVPLSEILRMYPLYHETDIERFAEEMNRRIEGGESKLRKLRTARGLSQSELARASEVSLRSIQMYEQKQNDIDKAQANTVYRLARAIGCDMEDLLERPMKQ